jgi:hypothetical protein
VDNRTSPDPEHENRGELLPSVGRSPFDAIKEYNDQGHEEWSARRVQPFLGYGAWHRFLKIIESAMTAARLSGDDVEANFSPTGEVSGTRGPSRLDYRLSRYACYLIAMRGDSHKAEIAQALKYFAIQTRKQEIAEERAAAAVDVPTPRRELTNRELAAMVIEEADRADHEKELRLVSEAKVEEMVPIVREIEQHRAKSEYVDVFVDGRQDVTSFRVYCSQIEVPERKFREHLIAKGIVYKKPISRRFSRSKGVWVTDDEYHPRADYKKWFHLKDQPEAPRHHNGQMRTTLYVTPLGKVKILEWLKRHPLGGAA